MVKTKYQLMLNADPDSQAESVQEHTACMIAIHDHSGIMSDPLNNSCNSLGQGGDVLN